MGEGVMHVITPFVWGFYNLFDGGILLSIFRHNPTALANSAIWIGASMAFCMILSYLIGSVNCALVISKLVYHEDVREHGSGNAGATNVLRTYGKKAGVLTLLGDGFKGVICILIACAIFGAPEAEPLYISQVHASYLAAFFCILGHVFPCFSKFRGGKGVATLALSLLFLNPLIFAALLAMFIALVGMSKYVSLGSVICAMFYPVMLHSFDSAYSQYGVGVYALMIGLLVLWAHRGNLKRIMDQTERKLSFSKKSRDVEPEEGENDNESV